MQENRRGFIGWVVCFVLSLIGFGKATAAPRDDSVARFRWLKRQLASGGDWQLGDSLKRFWNPASVTFSQVSCGAMTCPEGPEEEGFRARIRAARYDYVIVAKPHYLGCTLLGKDDGMADLPDGRFTLATWRRIVRRIALAETTGEIYGP